MPVTRLEGIEPTIFSTMSALAVRTGSVNLGQGFPDTDGPKSVLAAAADAVAAGHNQYAPGSGIPRCGRRSRATSSATTASSSTPTGRCA